MQYVILYKRVTRDSTCENLTKSYVIIQKKKKNCSRLKKMFTNKENAVYILIFNIEKLAPAVHLFGT